VRDKSATNDPVLNFIYGYVRRPFTDALDAGNPAIISPAPQHLVLSKNSISEHLAVGVKLALYYLFFFLAFVLHMNYIKFQMQSAA
jgi:hypothetical protein